MVNRHFRKTSLLFMLLVSSCSLLSGAPGSGPNRYYVLTEGAELREIARLPKLSLGVGPIELPDYLDRFSIATRSEANRVTYAENDRWAESLGGNVQRVLAADLSVLLYTERISLFPWYRTSAPNRAAPRGGLDAGGTSDAGQSLTTRLFSNHDRISRKTLA